jgi:hypothetical protein
MIEKTIAFLDNLTLADLDRLPPVRQQKFAALCHHWWQLAERRAGDRIVSEAKRALEPKGGVLRELGDGERSE